MKIGLSREKDFEVIARNRVTRKGNQDKNSLSSNNKGDCDFKKIIKGQLMPGRDNGQSKQSGHGEVKAAYKREWIGRITELYNIQVCFEVSFLEAGINEITEYYNMIPVKASLCTELNEEWLINIFQT